MKKRLSYQVAVARCGKIEAGLSTMAEMQGVGNRIRELRRQAQVTQKEVAARSGLTVSYLSRLENERITPSVRTLRRIAEALEVPVSMLFDRDATASNHEHCPVSLSGTCILEHRYSARSKAATATAQSSAEILAGEESYSQEQLEVLQQCNDLLQHSDGEVLTTLERLVRSLIMLQRARENAQRRQEEEDTRAVAHGENA
jgi:transcriptional regulator with XRE-family HTH domain